VGPQSEGSSAKRSQGEEGGKKMTNHPPSPDKHKKGEKEKYIEEEEHEGNKQYSWCV